MTPVLVLFMEKKNTCTEWQNQNLRLVGWEKISRWLFKRRYIGGGFKDLFVFIPIPGEMIQFDSIYIYTYIYNTPYFSDGLVQPPTRYSLFQCGNFSSPEKSFAGTLIHNIRPEPIVRNWKGGGPINGNFMAKMHGVSLGHISPL